MCGRMARAYEHGLVVQSSTLAEHVSDDDASSVGQALSERFVEVAGALDSTLRTLDGGGWEVVSHCVTIVNRVVVVNFLVRRPWSPADATTPRG